MSENAIVERITELAAPLAASLGLEIWGVEAAGGNRGLVRVFVENEDGVDIDKCAELSRLLGLSLEVEDVFSGAYVLEVSSPGLERTFFTAEQLAAHAGKTVEISLHSPCAEYPGRKKMTGTLSCLEGERFGVAPLDVPEDKRVAALFVWPDVKKAKLVHFLPEPPDAVKGRKGSQPRKAAKSAGPKQKESAPTPEGGLEDI